MTTSLSLPNLPTVLICQIMSFLQPNRHTWMMVYARLCLVSKSWGNIAAERLATGEDFWIMCRTDADFAALAVLLRHCGAPVLGSLDLTLTYGMGYGDITYYTGIHMQAILEQLAVGRAPEVGALTFRRVTFSEAGLVAFISAIRKGHLAEVFWLEIDDCQFSAQGGENRLMESLREHITRIPRLKNLVWCDSGHGGLIVARGLQRGACPRLERLMLSLGLTADVTIKALCGALTIGGESTAPCAQTLKELELTSKNGPGDLSPVWTTLCNALMDPNFTPKLKVLRLKGNTLSLEIRLQFQSALETRREKMGAAFCLDQVEM